MADLDMEPLKIVGFEGVFGTVFMVLLMLPAAYFLPGPEGLGLHEDTFDTLAMIRSSSALQVGEPALTAVPTPPDVPLSYLQPCPHPLSQLSRVRPPPVLPTVLHRFPPPFRLLLPLTCLLLMSNADRAGNRHVCAVGVQHVWHDGD
jgi:hypothetical protein